ncbi:entericidin A/B family lipoprotein [Janthinobacterium sp. 17J80-10]|nr:entericidin A/B family lipoprotein [Janthinobacterium sp. 17J80-10]QAU34044.1 entericidin A/B family lipoprotein [Janthinobacterium sp. 17J80-10]
MKKTLMLFLSTMVILTSLSACNTVKGFGKDVERGGETIQKGSDDVKK